MAIFSDHRWLALCAVSLSLLLLQTTLCAASVKQVKDEEDAYVTSEKFDESFVDASADDVVPTPEDVSPDDIEEDPIIYATPKAPLFSFIAETFDSVVSFDKTWIRSQTKKDGVEADLAKYDGVWKIEEPATPLLKGDRALVLKSKAKHSAISAPLSRPYKFGAKPFIVQYEVTLQEGQDCGGSYIKLLTLVDGKATKLKDFQDKTPYTIMFGPDKCGNDFKLHFIFRHVNPLDGSIEEKHANRPTAKLDEYFKDKKPHLYTLLIRPDNSFQISIDHTVVNSGNLLEDMTPAVNPEKEIADPDDFKPEDWDEREKIADPDDKKPEEWDDNAAKKIPDSDAAMPSGWLEEEPEMISDPEAVKPDDWDNDMDGEWEAALITNPACEGASGCGAWNRPLKDNPDYKGKWFPRQVSNSNYRGTWVPRMIPNPKYFEDLEPFKMSPISAVGFELWSMSENILFDNVLITDSIDEALQFAADTYDLKMAKMERGKGNIFQRVIEYSNERPWLYAIYVLLAAIPVVLFIMCCCVGGSGSDREQADRKKTDAATADDTDQAKEKPTKEDQEEQQAEPEDEEESEDDDDDDDDDDEDDDEDSKKGDDDDEDSKKGDDDDEDSKKGDDDDEEEEEGNVEEKQEQQAEEKVEEPKKEETPARASPRPRRRARKD